MKNNKAKLLAAAVAMGMSVQASAAIELYNQDNTTFSVDGYFNAFYVTEDNEAIDEKQSRVRMGFLPNWIGFNMTKDMGDLKLGGRSSFWVTINDGHENLTDTAIDVRQFYGTVDGDFGQFLIGKDFGLYSRANIFNDAILMGTGAPLDFAVNANGDPSGVTYGNIAVGYSYPAPVAQITYRTPVSNGFQLAVGVMDPESGETTEGNGSNNSARFEAEVTYATDFDGGKFSAWLSGGWGETGAFKTLTGDTDNNAPALVTAEADQEGYAYGASVTMGGLTLTASGYTQENIDIATGVATLVSDQEQEGYLLQGQYATGDHRFVLSHGATEYDGADAFEMNSAAYFYSVNSNLTLVGQIDQMKVADTFDIDAIAIGAVITY